MTPERLAEITKLFTGPVLPGHGDAIQGGRELLEYVAELERIRNSLSKTALACSADYLAAVGEEP